MKFNFDAKIIIIVLLWIYVDEITAINNIILLRLENSYKHDQFETLNVSFWKTLFSELTKCYTEPFICTCSCIYVSSLSLDWHTMHRTACID